MLSRSKILTASIVGLAACSSSMALAQSAPTTVHQTAGTSYSYPSTTHTASPVSVPVNGSYDGKVQRVAERVVPQNHPHTTYPAHHYPTQYYPAQYYPVQFNREAWLKECYARTGGKKNKEKGNIIGGLLGAITGGVIGNRAWSSERLAGSLIGAGAGGLVGSLIGGAISSSGKSDYDCEEALDRHFEIYGHGSTGHVQPGATRVIPAHAGHTTHVATVPTYHAPYPAAQVAYAPHSYHYQYAQPVMMVATKVPVQQRVVVREYVTEEVVEVEPVRERVIQKPVRVVPEQPTKLQPIK